MAADQPSSLMPVLLIWPDRVSAAVVSHTVQPGDLWNGIGADLPGQQPTPLLGGSTQAVPLRQVT